MMPRLLRRAPTLAILVITGLQLQASSGHAATPAFGQASALPAARTALSRLLQLAESADSRRGGQVALARRQADTSGARTTAAWLDWLPDFSVAVRRQVEQKTDTDLNAPRWRLDFEGQIALSLRKLNAIGVARAAQEKTQAELEQTACMARERALRASFGLYFAERKVELLRDQISQLESLASESLQTSRGAPASDHLLVQAYLDELRAILAKFEFEQKDGAQRLGALLGVPLEASGIDPRLALPLVLELIRAELSESSPRVAQIRRADTRLEEERLRWADSQRWYLPELRSSTLVQLPQGNAAGSSFRLTDITTEFALGFRLRPGLPALQAAQRHAIAKSHFDDEQSRWLREQTEDQARARLATLARLWLDDTGIRIASSALTDTLQRFARGERSVSELAATSRALIAAKLAREAIFREATLAQIMLSSNDRAGLAPSPEARREELASSEADRRSLAAVESASIVKSARAEAERAAQRVRSESFLLGTELQAGLSLPLYETGDTGLAGRPEFSFSGSGSLLTPVRETSLLGRWSLDLRAVEPAKRAFESEARLRRVQAERERRRYQWAELNARLELAHARKGFVFAQRAARFALEAWQREQRWFQQGSASERELRAAELASFTANVEQEKANARQRSAELQLGRYLGAARGTELTVTNETPEALERWSREHFLPDNGLLGFEGVGRRQEAELEAELAHAQTESLAKPARNATLTAQATQGLRGGAFSLTFALSVALDPPRESLRVSRAAEREGTAQGRLLVLARELEEQRARVQQRLDEANGLLDTEASIAQRLGALRDAVRAAQDGSPELHDALKQRQLAALESALLDSEKRRLEADEQRRTALLRTLALGNAASSSGPGHEPKSAALDDTVHALIERRADVAVADTVAAQARDHQPLPVASALQVVGPFAVGSYAASRVVRPSTTKVWRGDFGAGLALGLGESIAFIGSHELATATEQERAAARQKAALQAIHELGQAWTMRELERLSAQEETDAQHHLEASVQPRFALGQVAAGTATEAQQRHALARLRHSSDVSLLRTQYALLAALGAPLNDAALDEYQRRASVGSAATPTEGAPTDASQVTDSAELAAKSRSAAASTATTASALQLASPITGLVEFRPARVETTTGTNESQETTTGHELLWVFSLIVPFKPSAFGPLLVASAQAAESDEELGAASRSARLLRPDLRARLAALQKERAGATARRMSTERALAELDRRFRAAEDRTSIDELARLRQALFDARRAEVIALGATLEAALSLQALRENR